MTEQLKVEPKTLFGHPRGLYVLFFTELWERFSFYGMKALLIMYMVNHFVWSQEDASSLMGTYTGLAYATPLIGGLIADWFLGAKRAVLLGCVLLSVGHFLMAFESLTFFYTALGFIIAGVGLLKPNVSTQVGKLYPPGDHRRDGGFTIFYMGINLGAMFGPIVCDWLRVEYGWHFGFGAAGVGMILGLIVYVIGQRKLIEFNQEADEAGGLEEGHAQHAAKISPKVVTDRIAVLIIVFIFVILFWTAFEQSANVMVVWADKHTNLQPFAAEPAPVSVDFVASDDAVTSSEPASFAIGAGQTQSFNPFFIIVLAPVFAWLWLWLDRRNMQPSTPAKMAIGIGLMALAFLALAPAARLENRPSSAPLALLPSGVDLSQYGATRLTYDDDAAELKMNGVLSDVDRLKLLADTAPQGFKDQVADLIDAATEKSADPDRGEDWSVSRVITDVPPGVGLIGEEANAVLQWDETTATLTATGIVNNRARLEIEASGADPAFKEAIDHVYVTSSSFRVSIWWLVLHFMLITTGELCVSPVGLSLVTKMAPAKYVGLFMGGWFLATGIAGKVAHVFGGMWGTMTPSRYFMIFVVISAVGALLLAVLVRRMRRMMHGIN